MVKLPMTEETYTLLVGYPPTDDDLERVSCEQAGEFGHSSCGWNHCANLPNFSSSFHKTVCKCKL